jgi:alpha-N-arabinofuranosidase
MKKLMILLAGAFLSAGTSLLAQDATVRVHEAGTGVTIPAEIYGQFSEHLGRCIYGGLWVGKDSSVPNIEGYRKDVFDALKALKVPVMRWPGGCFADDYHWMDGIGPQEKRGYLTNTNWGGTLEDNSFGTHEFLNLCELLGIQPYISGNVGSGSVQEMSQWVEYMTSDAKTPMADLRRANGREEPWKVKYFGIGNEAWGCGGNMTPEYYSDLFRRYGTYLHDYAGNRLFKIASGASDYDYNWTRVLMRNLVGKGMAGISLHYYTVTGWNGPKGAATKFSDKDYYWLLSKTIEIEDVLRKHIEIMDELDRSGRVALLLDEWGTWYDVEPGTNPGHLYQQNTMRDAIVAALNFDIFHKYTRRLKMANIAQVVNVLQSMILTNETEMVLTPTYHVFEMYNVHQDAEFIESECLTGHVKTERPCAVPEVDATVSRKDGEMHLSLVNTDLKKARKVSVTFDGDGVSKILSARVLTSGDVHDYNDFGKPDVVKPVAFKDYKLTRGGIELTLPPCSVVVLAAK